MTDELKRKIVNNLRYLSEILPTLHSAVIASDVDFALNLVDKLITELSVTREFIECLGDGDEEDAPVPQDTK